jgi:hypothetical protein
MNLKKLCINGKLKTTPHGNIIEQLQIRTDRFRIKGRLRDEDLEEIIAEIKANKDSNNDDVRDGKATTAANDRHHKVLEAVEEGLLQVHGTAPNTTARNLPHHGQKLQGLQQSNWGK